MPRPIRGGPTSSLARRAADKRSGPTAQLGADRRRCGGRAGRRRYRRADRWDGFFEPDDVRDHPANGAHHIDQHSDSGLCGSGIIVHPRPGSDHQRLRVDLDGDDERGHDGHGSDNAYDPPWDQAGAARPFTVHRGPERPRRRARQRIYHHRPQGGLAAQRGEVGLNGAPPYLQRNSMPVHAVSWLVDATKRLGTRWSWQKGPEFSDGSKHHHLAGRGQRK